MDGSTLKYIPGWEGLYAASYDGRIYSYRAGRFMKQPLSCHGYQQVQLYRNNKYHNYKVHTLVLLAWVGPRPDGMFARHFPDNDRLNCCVENLSWCTPQQNHDDKVFHGTKVTGTRQRASKLTDDLVVEMRQLYATGQYTTVELSRMFGVNQSVAWSCVNGKTWKHVPMPGIENLLLAA